MEARIEIMEATRRHLGLKRTEFAKKLGVSMAIYRLYEKGALTIPDGKIKRMLDLVLLKD